VAENPDEAASAEESARGDDTAADGSLADDSLADDTAGDGPEDRMWRDDGVWPDLDDQPTGETGLGAPDTGGPDGGAADPPALTGTAGPAAGTAGPATPAAPGSVEAPRRPAARHGVRSRLGQAGAVAWLARLGRGCQRWWRGKDLAGRAFALVTVLPALLLTAWLVPGISLLLAGRFLPVPTLLIAAPVAVALVMLCGRDLPGRWPTLGRKGAAKQTANQPWAAWWGLGGTVVVAVGFVLWQLAVNSPQLIVSRDPGAYVQLGYWIAEHGSLPVPATLAAFGGSHPGLTFSSFGFVSHGSALAPQFMAGLPVTLSAGLWAHGIPGGAMVSPILGGLAIITVGGLTGRLAGPQWAPLGAVLLALTVPEVYTSRSAFSETLVQALLFGGLCMVVDSLFAKRPWVLAAIGGLVLGLVASVSVVSLLALLPVIPFAGALLAGRRRQGIPFAVGVVAGAGLGIGSGIAFGVPIANSTTPTLRAISLITAGFVVVTAVAVGVALIAPARRWTGKVLARRPMRWLPEVAAVIVVAAAIGFAVRPYLQTVHGQPNPYVGALQRLAGLPVDPGRLYSERSLYWVIWYLGIPALLLGVAGLAMVTRLCLRALLRWRDPSGMARAWALPAAVFLWGFLAVLWLPGTVPDQPWASRRLVPVVLPGLVLLAVWVAAWIIVRAQRRGAGIVALAGATACFVAAFALPPAAITFELGPWHASTQSVRLALTGIAFRSTGAGEYATDVALCSTIGNRSSVLVLDEPAARTFGPVIRDFCGVPVGIVTDGSQPHVAAVVGSIERSGRRAVLLASRAAELAPYQTRPQRIVNLTTQEDAHVLTEPPTSTWPVNYTLWMSVPAGTFGS
jgi:hypothetical protein